MPRTLSRSEPPCEFNLAAHTDATKRWRWPEVPRRLVGLVLVLRRGDPGKLPKGVPVFEPALVTLGYFFKSLTCCDIPSSRAARPRLCSETRTQTPYRRFSPRGICIQSPACGTWAIMVSPLAVFPIVQLSFMGCALSTPSALSAFLVSSALLASLPLLFFPPKSPLSSPSGSDVSQ